MKKKTGSKELDEVIGGLAEDAERDRGAGLTPSGKPKRYVKVPQKPSGSDILDEQDRFVYGRRTLGDRFREFKMTPRQSFTALAIALAIILVALIIVLLWLLSNRGAPGQRGGEVVNGLKPLFTIEGPGTGPNPRFVRPMGVAFGVDRRIYVSDTGNDRVCVFDRDGKFLFEFGGHGIAKPLPGSEMTWKPGLFNFPVGVDVDNVGNVFVADFRNDQVQAFDRDGKFLRAFPSPFEPTGQGGSGQEGKGIAVTDVAAQDGLVYATDAYQIVVFTTEGEFVRQFGRPGRGPGELDHPNGVAISPNKTVYVSDSNHTRVMAFDQIGNFLWEIGRVPAGPEDQSERDFGLPRGLTVMRDGSLLVADAFGFELVRVSQEGSIEDRYGSQGVAPGTFSFPNDVDSVEDVVVVADKENNRVQVLQLVPERR